MNKKFVYQVGNNKKVMFWNVFHPLLKYQSLFVEFHSSLAALTNL